MEAFIGFRICVKQLAWQVYMYLFLVGHLVDAPISTKRVMKFTAFHMCPPVRSPFSFVNSPRTPAGPCPCGMICLCIGNRHFLGRENGIVPASYDRLARQPRVIVSSLRPSRALPAEQKFSNDKLRAWHSSLRPVTNHRLLKEVQSGRDRGSLCQGARV